MPDEIESDTATPATPLDPISPGDLKHCKAAAIALVQRCVRNTQLEDLHAGTFPGSQTGIYDDVKVVTPYGEIPWNELSRISDAEMKALMIEVANKVFTFLVHCDHLSDRPLPAKWDEPQFDDALLALAIRRKQSSNA